MLIHYRTAECNLYKMTYLSFAKSAFLLVSAVTSVTVFTCEVPGGTSDDGPAIKAALTKCNNGGMVSKVILPYITAANGHDQVVLDKTYTISTVLQTTGLNNVAIQLSGTINLSPRVHNVH
jgi:hypothetical protein